MKKYRRIKYLLCSIFCCSLFFITGCSDMREIQDRDFIMAMGLSYSDQYQVVFTLPDLDAITGQSKTEDIDRHIRFFEGSSFPLIEDLYNQSSENHLDYRHLETVILDDSIFHNEDGLESFLQYTRNEYTFSRNVLIFYYPGNIGDLFHSEGNLAGNIGNFLKKLTKNNSTGDPASIGGLIDSMDNHKTLMIPTLKLENERLSIDGSLLYSKDRESFFIGQENTNLYHMLKGQGTDYVFQIDHTTITISDLTSSWDYTYRQHTPYVKVNIKGTYRILEDAPKAKTRQLTNGEIHRYIVDQSNDFLNITMKKKGLDVLNLYDKSSYKNPMIWNAYDENLDGFLNDTEVIVSLQITKES